MNRVLIFIVVAVFVSMVSCGSGGQKQKEELVSIQTEFGEIKVKLYDDTPLHKINFLKLVSEGFYNDLLFHRVINNFMIQGGDPSSKNAEPGKRLGGGSPEYMIDAEFLPKKYFHKKGALAAARTGGAANPEKRSSGSQFYIIHGKTFTDGALDTMQMVVNRQKKNDMLKEYLDNAKDELQDFRNNNDQQGFNIRIAELREEVDSVFESSEDKFVFSAEQRELYKTIGGYPSLDGEYTVLGEVVEGLDVLDKIAAVETDKYNRPLQDVKMKVELVK